MKDIALILISVAAFVCFTLYISQERPDPEVIQMRTYTAENCDSCEYQILLEYDSLVVSSYGRHVATVGYDQIGVLDSIFIEDNR